MPDLTPGKIGFGVAVWLLANVLLVGLYDIWAWAFGAEDSSVSYWCQRWFTELPILAILVGVVIGHLAWPLHRGK